MSNVDTARSAFQAFRSGDLAALKEFYAHDAVWYSSDEVTPGGEKHSRDAIVEMMAQVPEHWSTFSLEPREYLDAGAYVVVLGTHRFGNDRGSAEAPFVNIVEFDRSGKAVRGEFHSDSAKMARLQR
ncbi:nuclear transport factor 2 family protein [Mycobacterium sp. 1274756.6]|uniref:nuclear transport factor 2 family protein n=1 Tax=Mycobacterium sp. 1274756.6 TaxID=1834076 RepID=UPI0007FF67F2|nr:nuclear transport factor 2 family protein [Mycobacterium sp. 1274756.6]OBJ73609.1 hypothetical protein A5643_03460 [Mycobacterium sp. 1274756.6]